MSWADLNLTFIKNLATYKTKQLSQYGLQESLLQSFIVEKTQMLKEWIQSLRELFSDDAEGDDDLKALPIETKPLPAPMPVPRRTLRPAPESNRRIVIIVPISCSDEKEIADCLKQGSAVIVDYTALDAASAKRIFRFLSGFIFASGGQCQQISKDIFLYSTVPSMGHRIWYNQTVR